MVNVLVTQGSNRYSILLVSEFVGSFWENLKSRTVYKVHSMFLTNSSNRLFWYFIVTITKPSCIVSVVAAFNSIWGKTPSLDASGSPNNICNGHQVIGSVLVKGVDKKTTCQRTSHSQLLFSRERSSEKKSIFDRFFFWTPIGTKQKGRFFSTLWF